LYLDLSEVFFVGGFLLDEGAAGRLSLDSEISQKLVTMDGSVGGLGLSEVEGALELSVISVVLLITVGQQVQVASSLVSVKN
jgi:hypothetical protein